ncbi:MAG TPA: phosphoribosylformylglycinamidine synthase I [bacterium]|nr:phosphoribosylformylglycinamidine synthase I [bacterium]
MIPGVLVLRAAGSNCDDETKFAFEQAGARADLVHVNRLLNGEVKLENYQILAIPGGFTYGDDISAGKVLANQLKYKLAEKLHQFYNDKKLIIGICNGFQVLVKAGLLPVVDFTAQQTVTLTINDSGKYEDRWVYLKVNDSPCVFTRNSKATLHYPVAHTEGKFVPQDDQTLQYLIDNKLVVFQYISPDGKKPAFPWNPNGSVHDIAGICDPSGRILGLMPHPERNIDPTHSPFWTRNGLAAEGDGLALFKNAVQYFK